MKIFLFFACAIASTLALTACSPKTDSSKADDKSREDAIIERAKNVVLENLRDPSSAQFKNVRLYGSWVCGEVNSKNGFGGYAGYERFSVDAANPRVVGFGSSATSTCW